MGVSQGSTQLSIGRVASLACLLEVAASKPGNVHRGADFVDMTLNDFLVSAELLGHAIDSRKTDELGLLVLNAVTATSSLVPVNTNLGIALLICPLAIVANDGDLSSAAIRQLLKSSTAADAESIYQAIKIANPGGLGDSAEHDVNQSDAPTDIFDAMRFSSDKDQIALQYCNNFQQVFEEVVPLLAVGNRQFDSINDTIIYAHVSMLARYGDSLIQRKCGHQTNEQAKAMACRCLERMADQNHTAYLAALSELDFWLRADGNARNPGTTADLITAGLFVAIINEEISSPFR